MWYNIRSTSTRKAAFCPHNTQFLRDRVPAGVTIMEKKNLITPWDALPLLALLLAAAALFLWLNSRPAAVTAVVEREGDTLWAQDLASLNGPLEKVVDGAGGHRVTVVLTPAGGCISASTCPDQTCVRTGALTHAGESALCLPARVSLRLVGPAAGFDAVTY